MAINIIYYGLFDKFGQFRIFLTIEKVITTKSYKERNLYQPRDSNYSTHEKREISTFLSLYLFAACLEDI